MKSDCRGLLCWFLLLLTSATATQGALTLNLEIQRRHPGASSGGSDVWFAFPSLDANGASVPLTMHVVAGPNTNHWGFTSTNGGGTTTDLHFTLPDLLNALNGTWTLILNEGDPSEQTNHFTVAIAGLSSNSFPAATIYVPLDGSTDQPPTPAYHWNGPTSWEQLYAVIHTDNYSSYELGFLAPNATNWPSAPPTPPGPNVFELNYQSNAAPFVTISAPTNEVGGAPVPDWASQSKLSNLSQSQFTVTAADGGTPAVLKAHFNFDNSGFTGEDSSSNGYHIAFPTWCAIGPPVYGAGAGVSGGAMIYHGSNWHRLDTNLLPVVVSNFSISMWVKTTDTFGSDTDPAFAGAGFFSATDYLPQDNRFIPLAMTGSKAAFTTSDPDYNYDTVHSTMDINNTGDYVHLVVTRAQASGRMSLYVNGVLEDSALNNTSLYTNFTGLALGHMGDCYHGVASTIDEVQIYCGVLSSNQVAYMYANPTETAPPELVEVPLPEALDATDLTWDTYGDTNWFGQTLTSYDGIDAAQSGALTDGQYTELSTEITGPGTLTFWWKIYTTNSDYLDFNADWGTSDTIYNDTDWEQKSYPVPAGTWFVYWYYYADGSEAGNVNAGWVDSVVFTPDAPPPAISNQPMSCVTLEGTAAGFLVGASGDPAYQWRFNSVPINGATNSFLILTNTVLTNSGDYTVVLSNLSGSVTSMLATLTVTNIAEVPPFVLAVGPHAIGASASTGQQVATDGSNNVYFAGTFNGTNNFGIGNLVAIGNDNGFLAKLNGQGNVLWMQRVGGSNTFPNALTVTPNGRVLLAGSFQGTGTFGAHTLTNAGGFDGFVARFDANGNSDFAQRWGGPNNDYVEGVDADANGNIYATGLFQNSGTVGSNSLTGSGLGALLARFGTNGAVHWLVRPDTNAIGFDVEVQSNAIYWCGIRFENALTIGSSSIPDTGGRMFLARLNTNGTDVWLRAAGSDDQMITVGYNDFQCLAEYPGGGVYMGGRVVGTNATFGATVLPSSSGFNTFLSRWNTNGQVQFARLVGNSNTMGVALAGDPDVTAEGYAFMAGSFVGPTDFGGICLFNGRGPGYNPADIGLFVAGYDTNGALLGVRGSEATNNAGVGLFVSGVAGEIDGQLYVSGTASNGVNFGNLFFAASNGVTRAVLAKVDPGASPLIWQSVTNSAGSFQFSFHSQAGRTHVVEYRDDLQSGTWLHYTSLPGTGGVLTIVQPGAGLPKRFFRVITQ